MKILRVCLITTVVLFSLSAFAQMPELINYQGRLVNGSGIVTGDKALVFRLFTNDVGGVESYAETQTVTVIDGLYSTMIGASNPTPGALTTALSSQPCWLEVEVDGTPLTPRERLVAVPFALSANESDPLWSAEKSAYATGTPLYVDEELPPSAIVLSEDEINTNLVAAGFSILRFGTDTPPSAAWILATNSASWTPRYDHASLVYGGKMWILGGDTPYDFTNDVWSSTDGASWVLATSNASWTRRYGHAALVYDGKMWVLGGYTSSGWTNDVWSSTDGAAWVLATNSASWSPRRYHAALVHDGKLWVLGGNTSGGNVTNDVWSSTDGATWDLATNRAPWAPRASQAALVHDGKMWVLGGYTSVGSYTNDVWSSTDGAGWVLATSSASWSPRHRHAALVHDENLWVLGGYTSVGYSNDVWSSTDGAGWVLATSSASWVRRYGHAALVYDGKIWVLGGNTPYGAVNDTWHSWDIGAAKMLDEFFLYKKD